MKPCWFLFLAALIFVQAQTILLVNNVPQNASTSTTGSMIYYYISVPAHHFALVSVTTTTQQQLIGKFSIQPTLAAYQFQANSTTSNIMSFSTQHFPSSATRTLFVGLAGGNGTFTIVAQVAAMPQFVQLLSPYQAVTGRATIQEPAYYAFTITRGNAVQVFVVNQQQQQPLLLFLRANEYPSEGSFDVMQQAAAGAKSLDVLVSGTTIYAMVKPTCSNNNCSVSFHLNALEYAEATTIGMTIAIVISVTLLVLGSIVLVCCVCCTMVSAKREREIREEKMQQKQQRRLQKEQEANNQHFDPIVPHINIPITDNNVTVPATVAPMYPVPHQQQHASHDSEPHYYS